MRDALEHHPERDLRGGADVTASEQEELPGSGPGAGHAARRNGRSATSPDLIDQIARLVAERCARRQLDRARPIP
ncbi:hypothetical protein SAV14893_092840 [Streptomyces avermitilis]|uniref:Uncharacterized protein n=1 Tax=Streptomyces avermitilis TaxID=33903 RepID=A0A4D4MD81_STRAX|nr:hypothetical protein SAV14893_092840 [Streptomyces avermitilis]